MNKETETQTKKVSEWGLADLLRSIEKNFELYLSSLLLTIYSGIILYSIAERFLFQDQPLWALEMAVGMFIWVAWLSTAHVIRVGDHLRFTLMLERLSNAQRYALYVLEWILWVLFAGLVFWVSIPVLGLRIGKQTTFTGTSIPDWFTYLAIPVGLALILIRVLQQAVEITRRFRSGEDITGETGVEV